MCFGDGDDFVSGDEETGEAKESNDAESAFVGARYLSHGSRSPFGGGILSHGVGSSTLYLYQIETVD